MPQGQQPDYAALAKQFGGTSQPVQAGPSSQSIDDLVKQFGGTTQPAPAPERSMMADIGIGALKGTGRMVVDAARMMEPIVNPMAMLDPRLSPTSALPIDRLEPSNTTQRIAGFIPDIASVAVPVGLEAKGARLLRRGTEWLEQKAVKGIGEYGAKQALDRGLGRITKENAAELAKLAKASPVESKIQVMRRGKFVPRTVKPSKLQPAADAMSEAAAKPSAPIGLRDAGLPTMGFHFFNPYIGGAIAAWRAAMRPGVQATAAQLLHSAAPAIQGTVAGGAAVGLERLIREQILERLAQRKP